MAKNIKGVKKMIKLVIVIICIFLLSFVNYTIATIDEIRKLKKERNLVNSIDTYFKILLKTLNPKYIINLYSKSTRKERCELLENLIKDKNISFNFAIKTDVKVIESLASNLTFATEESFVASIDRISSIRETCDSTVKAFEKIIEPCIL